jgi:hypothetical protein
MYLSKHLNTNIQIYMYSKFKKNRHPIKIYKIYEFMNTSMAEKLLIIKHMWICLSSLIIRKIQMKSKIRQLCAPTRIANVKCLPKHILVKIWRTIFYNWLMGLYNVAVLLKIIFNFFKTLSRHTWSAHSTPIIHPKNIKSYVHTKICI